MAVLTFLHYQIFDISDLIFNSPTLYTFQSSDGNRTNAASAILQKWKI